jgi:hypothetical protein
VDDGRTMSDLKIEKERLETTVRLLQQKLNDKNDDEEFVFKMKDGKREADNQRNEYQTENIALKS